MQASICTRALLSATSVVLCTAADASPAVVYEGFRLGMSQAAASAIHPEAPWEAFAYDEVNKVIRKAFASRHLNLPAQVTVDVSPLSGHVVAIGITAMAAADAECISEAVAALADLERTYGEESEVSHAPPGKRATWLAKDGLIVRWGELCASGAKRYYITYRAPGA
jgi:hypothetical protein